MGKTRDFEQVEGLKREDHDSLCINVAYTLGGTSCVTGNVTPRGIHVYLTPCVTALNADGERYMASSMLMSDVDESGYRVFVKSLKRKSQKDINTIFELLKPKFKEIAELFVKREHLKVLKLIRDTVPTDLKELVKANVEAQKKPDVSKGQVLINKGVQAILDKQGNTSELMPKDIKVACKLFNPMGVGEWWVYDRDKNNPDVLWIFANLGDPVMSECGTISLKELETHRPRIERSTNFANGKTTLQEVINEVQGR